MNFETPQKDEKNLQEQPSARLQSDIDGHYYLNDQGKREFFRDNPNLKQTIYQKQAEKMGIKPTVEGEWTLQPGNNMSLLEMAQWRLNGVGTFDSNNGTIAYIDQEGNLFTAEDSPELRENLEKANYKKGSFHVPPKSVEQYSFIEKRKL